MAVLFSDAGGWHHQYFVCVADAEGTALASVPTEASNIMEAELQSIRLALHFIEDATGTIFNDSQSAVALCRDKDARTTRARHTLIALEVRSALPEGWGVRWVPGRYNKADKGVRQAKKRFGDWP
jgi:hypothetical protein